ncbi:MAG: DUF92 domain-containing protein [Flavobacteriales bacterium]|nr:MAG: DUF92 domain-containing protein [Flavobacteriales bacterium]
MNHTAIAAGLALPFIWLCLRLKILTLGGGVMAGLIAMAVVASQGWPWLIPLFVFLISGVLLGRLNKTARTDAKHGKPRDAVQVFCNGGVYAVLALFAGNEAFIWMAVSICISTCDTWASEVGMYARWPTINLATFKRVPIGLSGGVSLAGTMAGFVGAFVVGMVTWPIAFPELSGHNAWSVVLATAIMAFVPSLWLAAIGSAGMLLDSLLGAFLQAKYDDGAGISDRGTRQVGGFRWMTNDLVNLISNAATVGVAMLWL